MCIIQTIIIIVMQIMCDRRFCVTIKIQMSKKLKMHFKLNSRNLMKNQIFNCAIVEANTTRTKKWF
jgi:hypothetical protein